MDEQETTSQAAAPAKTAGSPSRWEWLPVVACLCLGLAHFQFNPASGASRFSLFVGLGLLPGSLWRLCGRRSWNVHRICFALGLIAFVLDNPELRPDRATLGEIAANWRLVALGMVVSFTQSLWGSLRTQCLLVDCGVRISLANSLKLNLIGSFFSIFMPGSTGGDAYRIYALGHVYRVRLGQAIATISIDRFLGLPSLILVVVLGMAIDYQFFLSNRTLRGLAPFITGAGVICLVLVAYLALAGKRHRRSGRELPTEQEHPKKAGWLGRTHAMIVANVKSPATLPLALFYGFAAHLACILSCLCLGLALGVEGVPPLRYFLIIPMAMSINAIPGAPGGVGQGEVAMAALLDMASPGMGNAQVGVMVMLLFRLSNMAVGLLGGVLYLLGKSGPEHAGHVADDIRRELAETAAILDHAGDGEA